MVDLADLIAARGESTSPSAPKIGPSVPNRLGIIRGDVFVCSWGYDQTNVDAFVVVRTTRASVEVMKGHFSTIGEGHSTRLVPDRNRFTPFDDHTIVDGQVTPQGTIRKVVQEGGSSPYIRVFNFWGGIAHLWDGETSYYDTHAAGYMGH